MMPSAILRSGVGLPGIFEDHGWGLSTPASRAVDRLNPNLDYGSYANPICYAFDVTGSAGMPGTGSVNGALIRQRLLQVSIPQPSAENILTRIGGSSTGQFLIHGPASAGKSRLLGQYEKQARARGELVFSTDLTTTFVRDEWKSSLESAGIFSEPPARGFWQKLTSFWQRNERQKIVETCRSTYDPIVFFKHAGLLARDHDKILTVLIDEVNASGKENNHEMLEAYKGLHGLKKIFVFGYVNESGKDRMREVTPHLPEGIEILELQPVTPELIKANTAEILAGTGIGLSDKALTEIMGSKDFRLRDFHRLLNGLSFCEVPRIYTSHSEILAALKDMGARNQLNRLNSGMMFGGSVILAPDLDFRTFYAKSTSILNLPRRDKEVDYIPVCVNMARLLKEGTAYSVEILNGIVKTIVDNAGNAASDVTQTASRIVARLNGGNVSASFAVTALASFAEHYNNAHRQTHNIKLVFFLDDTGDLFDTPQAAALSCVMIDSWSPIIVRRSTIDDKQDAIGPYMLAHMMNGGSPIDTRTFPAGFFDR